MNIEGPLYGPGKGGGGGVPEDLRDRQRREEALRLEKEKVHESRKSGERVEEDDNYWRAEPYFKMMVSDLRLLGKENVDEKEKDEAKERLGKRYDQVGIMMMGEMADCMNDTVEKYRNPHPYDSTTVHRSLDNMNEVLRRAEMDFKDNKEAMGWVKKIRRDWYWAEGIINIMDGVGPAVLEFWSGRSMMNVVRNKVRRDPEARDFLKAFAESLPGLEVEEGEDGEKKEGLREKAVRFQDDNVFWRMAISSVGKMEYKRSEDGLRLEMPMKLSEAEIRFIQLVFGRGDDKGDEWVDYYGSGVRMPKSILNLYTCDSSENSMEEYRSLMRSMLCLGVKEKLGNVSSEEELMVLVNEVKEDGERRRATVFDQASLETEDWLANVVTKFGTVFDWGSGASAEMGWGWEYKLGDDGVTVEREMVWGGTTTATDLTTERYWLASHISNKKKGWDVSPMLPKMSKKMVKLFENIEPATRIKWNWKEGPKKTEEMEEDFNPKIKGETDKVMEEIREFAANDPRLKRAMEDLFSFDWTEEQREYLEKNMWLWDTGVMVKNNKVDEGVRLVLPVFFPPEIEGLNFFDTVSLVKKRANVKKGDPSVWQVLSEGKKMSEIDWWPMQNQKFYKWMITMGQALNTTTVLLLAMDENNKGDFMKFFATNDNIGPLLKRTDLTFRDGKQPVEMLTMSYVSFIVPLFVAKYQAKITGSDAGNPENQAAFVERMSEWWDEIDGLPEKRGGIENYNQGMKKMLELYIKLISRMGFVIGDRKGANKVEDFEAVKGLIDDFTENRRIIGSQDTGRSFLEGKR